MLQNLNPSTMLFLVILILSSLLSITSNNLIIIWVGLEMNLMCFIPLMLSKKEPQELEGAVKYFIIQAPTTIIMMTMMIAFEFKMNMGILSPTTMILMVLLVKMGSAPFHMWFPQVMKSLNWLSMIIILTWQKITPMFILSLIYPSKYILFVSIIVMNNFIGAFGGLSQSNMRGLLAYSSFSHFSWMLMAFLLSWDLMMLYFMFYCLMNMFVITPMSKMNSKSALNFKNLNQMHKENQVALWVDMMSMAGLPPLLGFLPKWMVVMCMVSYSPTLVFVLMIGSLISLFYYLRVVMTMMLTSDLSTYFGNKMKWMHLLAWSRLPLFFYYFLMDDFLIMS